MNHATLVETLRPLPRPQRERIDAQLDRLNRACEAPGALQPFLEEVLDVLGRIFGGTAGAFWIPNGDGTGLDAAVRVGFERLPLSADHLAAVDHTLVHHWRSAEPAAQPIEDTRATVLVGPVRDGDQPVGAFQLVVMRREGNEDELFPDALGSVLGIIQPALLRRMRVRTVGLPQVDQGLDLLGQRIAGIQRSIRTAIEQYLHQLTGASFGGLSESQQFTKRIQRLLDAHGLRVRCPECGHPAILRCARNASVPTGVFVFDHYLPEGRTFHGGGRTVPVLRVTSKPPRRQSS